MAPKPADRPRPPRAAALLAALAMTLAACAELQPLVEPPAEAPAAAPSDAVAPVPLPRPQPGPVSAQSRALSERFAGTEAALVAEGRLRTDDGAADAPFDATDLTASFMEVALFDEYSTAAGVVVARRTARPLRRWSEPVRVRAVFGPSVPADIRAADRALLAGLVPRLAAATGHDIALTDGAANFLVYVLDEDERRAFAPQLVDTIPGMTPAIARSLRDLPPTEFCAVVSIYDDASPTALRRALAFIRAELPARLRASCYHEELAQGLGLANDSPVARPSIFNDDEEFALLTGMDELLLRMLYDPRLQPGMDSAAALPIVEEIAAGLTGAPPPDAPGETADLQGEG